VQTVPVGPAPIAPPPAAPINPETAKPYAVYKRAADGDRGVPKNGLYLIYENGIPILYRSKGP
jgi:hypothetical protein